MFKRGYFLVVLIGFMVSVQSLRVEAAYTEGINILSTSYDADEAQLPDFSEAGFLYVDVYRETYGLELNASTSTTFTPKGRRLELGFFGTIGGPAWGHYRLTGGTIDESGPIDSLYLDAGYYYWDIACEPLQVFTLEFSGAALPLAPPVSGIGGFAYIYANIISSDIPPIPAPGAIMLGSIGIGIGMFGWLRKRKML